MTSLYVAGGEHIDRNTTDHDTLFDIFNALDTLSDEHPFARLITAHIGGAEQLAVMWAEQRGIPVTITQQPEGWTEDMLEAEMLDMVYERFEYDIDTYAPDHVLLFSSASMELMVEHVERKGTPFTDCEVSHALSLGIDR